jgi:hypothetical protein
METERESVVQFFLAHWHAGGFIPTREIFAEFRREFPKTKLTVMGFARMIPAIYKHGVKKIHGKVVRGVHFGK